MTPGLLGRVFGRRQAAPEHLVDDGSLRVVGQALVVERGDAAVLAEIAAAGHDLSRPLLVRHLFTVHPAGDPTTIVDGLQADGYDVDLPSPGQLRASATLVLTTLGASQARARMTGLTTRHPVDYLGWEALAPASEQRR